MTVSSTNLVLFTLAIADRPLSISDIQFRCGLSYNTVKRAVFGNKQVIRHDEYPARFSVAKPEALSDDVIWARYDKPDEGWITWLNQIRPLLVSITAMPDDMSKDELLKKAGMFNSLGRSFLSLAKDMERLSDHDDWAHYLDWSDE